MSVMAKSPEQKLQELIDVGLEYYGRGDLGVAERCWQEALQLSPDNAMILDYLRTAGFEPAPAQVIQLVERREQKELSTAEKLKEYIRGNRFDEALSLLYEAKQKAPENNEAVTKTLQYIKDKKCVAIGKRLGSLDQVVEVGCSPALLAELQLTEDERAFIKGIDGVSTIGDIVRTSSLERHESLALIEKMMKRSILTLKVAFFSLPNKTMDAEEVEIAAQLAPISQIDQAPIEEEEEEEEKTVDFDSTFREATLAYMKRDYQKARELFILCRQLRPDDSRVKHNLDRLDNENNSL